MWLNTFIWHIEFALQNKFKKLHFSAALNWRIRNSRCILRIKLNSIGSAQYFFFSLFYNMKNQEKLCEIIMKLYRMFPSFLSIFFSWKRVHSYDYRYVNLKSYVPLSHFFSLVFLLYKQSMNIETFTFNYAYKFIINIHIIYIYIKHLKNHSYWKTLFLLH